MLAASLARKGVLALGLSVWMLCLSVLPACENCPSCQVDCQNQCCCQLLSDECCSSSRQVDRFQSTLSRGNFRGREPERCACCRYRSIVRSLTQNPSTRSTCTVGQISGGARLLQIEPPSFANIKKVMTGPETAEGSLDGCVRLCRFAI